MKKWLKIAIGADHAGFDYKQAILGMFDGYITFHDFGAYSTESADYRLLSLTVRARLSEARFEQLTVDKWWRGSRARVGK